MAYRLLLMDDSVTIRRVIELTFAGEDVEVTTVGDGRAAMERIEADPPDIVLADAGTASPDGYEVASFVKSNPALAHIPVLLLSGAFQPIDQARATKSRCDGVLAKPFELQSVIARVRALLEAAGGIDRPQLAEAFEGAVPAFHNDDPPDAPKETPAQEVVVSLQEYLGWLEELIGELTPGEADADKPTQGPRADQPGQFPLLTSSVADTSVPPVVRPAPFCLDDYFDLVDEVLSGRATDGSES